MTQLTYTEILMLAISGVDFRIREINEKFESRVQSPEAEKVIENMRERWRCKRRILAQLYKIETGKDYT